MPQIGNTGRKAHPVVLSERLGSHGELQGIQRATVSTQFRRHELLALDKIRGDFTADLVRCRSLISAFVNRRYLCL